MKILLLSLFFAVSACNDQYPDLQDGMYAEMNTSKGIIMLQLEFEKTPVTVANFISLAEGNNTLVSEDYKGKKFYDGLKFHRVLADFMIQGGCPLGTGTGDPGYKFMDEFDDSLTHSGPGILSMANSGPKTNGSQFFITHKATPWLNNKHTVFGHVVGDGQKIVDSIAQDDLILSVKIIRKGKAANAFDASKIFAGNKAAEQKESAAKEAKSAGIKAETVAYFNKHRANAEKLASGIEIAYITKGDGVKPEIGTKVLVNYAGFLTDGKLFDSNVKEWEVKHNMLNPLKVKNNDAGYQCAPMDYSPEAGLIQGFREGLLNMRTGDKTLIYIPAHLGYGPQGAGGVIPPNADLIFELEIVPTKAK